MDCSNTNKFLKLDLPTKHDVFKSSIVYPTKKKFTNETIPIVINYGGSTKTLNDAILKLVSHTHYTYNRFIYEVLCALTTESIFQERCLQNISSIMIEFNSTCIIQFVNTNSSPSEQRVALFNVNQAINYTQIFYNLHQSSKSSESSILCNKIIGCCAVLGIVGLTTFFILSGKQKNKK